MALPSWLSVSPTSGEKNGKLTLTATPHTGRLERSFTVIGTTGHGTKKNLSITQAAAEEQISVVGVFVDNTKLEPDSNLVTINFGAKDSRTIRIYFKSNSATLRLVDSKGNLFYPDGTGASQPTIKLYLCDINKIDSFPTPGLKDQECYVEGNKVWTNSKSNLIINGDPGAAAMCGYYMIISDIPEVKDENEGKNYNMRITNADGSFSSDLDIAFKQAAGIKSYSTPIIKTFTYPDVPAAGLSNESSISPTITVEQTWGWNGDVINGGEITNTEVPSAFTYIYNTSTSGYAGWTLDKTTGKITNIASLGTVASDARKLLDSVKVAVTANGKTSSADNTVDVYQKPNIATYNTPEFVWVSNDPGITVGSNNNVTISFSNSQSLKSIYSGIIMHNTQTINYSSGSFENLIISANEFNEKPETRVCKLTVTNPVEGFALEAAEFAADAYVTVTENYDDTARNGFVVKVDVTINGVSATATITFNQQAGGSTLTFNPTEVSFDAAGGTKEVTITSNDSWTITF